MRDGKLKWRSDVAEIFCRSEKSIAGDHRGKRSMPVKTSPRTVIVITIATAVARELRKRAEMRWEMDMGVRGNRRGV
jgi:hypothetical protein